MFELSAYTYLLFQLLALVTMSRRMRSKTTASAESPLASAEEDATLAIGEGTLMDGSGPGVAETLGGLGEVLTV